MLQTRLELRAARLILPCRRRWSMIRKDSEKDTERAHYYSQFWLDVAAGRREIGTPRPDEEAQPVEAETPEPTPLRKAGRGSTAPVTDGHKVTRAQTVVEPEYPPEEVVEPEEEEIGLASVVDDMDLPNILVDDTLEDTTSSDLDHAPEEEEPEMEEEEIYYDEDEDEDEDEDSWTARGRKKPKPGRQVKQPKKKPRREPHRGF
jgi:hypothetical protein